MPFCLVRFKYCCCQLRGYLDSSRLLPLGAGHPVSLPRLLFTMPQVSQRPPPYTKDKTVFPPPLQGDVAHRAWTFQCAFENAREIVRWTILETFEVWTDAWVFKGRKIPRKDLQQAYSQAPKELQVAVDWQLQWDFPVILHDDGTRRWHEHVRRKEAGMHEDVLPLGKFEEELNSASPAVRRAVQLTIVAWRKYNESIREEPPRQDCLVDAYNDASASLKAALCFVLEMGLSCPIQRQRTIDETKADMYLVVEQHRAQVIPYWNAHGRAAGHW
ncbi:hypothetical protein PENSPDRAFT_377986 [Peniophora sp. CONT]|nr:hypothetical protein PENSPDRAFT_377986 [Peniophora sp. CONT]